MYIIKIGRLTSLHFFPRTPKLFQSSNFRLTFDRLIRNPTISPINFRTIDHRRENHACYINNHLS